MFFKIKQILLTFQNKYIIFTISWEVGKQSEREREGGD
jgi:hypothetical protein